MTIKPRKNDNASLEAAKGLARWDWIKKYLGPAMKYIGISGDQFDRLFIGKDQMIDEQRQAVSEWALPKISIGSGSSTPTGSAPTSRGDGYFYIEYDVAFTNKVIEFDMVPPITYEYTRYSLVMVSPPAYKFYTTQQSNYFTAEVNQSGIGQGDTATIKTLIGARIDGKVNTFGYTNDSLVIVSFNGSIFVYFHTV